MILHCERQATLLLDPSNSKSSFLPQEQIRKQKPNQTECELEFPTNVENANFTATHVPLLKSERKRYYRIMHMCFVLTLSFFFLG